MIVPRSPGTLCALGSLVTDLRRDFIRTVSVDLLHREPQALEQELAVLTEQAFDWLASQDTAMTDRKVEASADMRYRGQSFDLTVPFERLDTESLLHGFHQQYERIYGFSDPKADVEITNLRVAAIGITGKPRQSVDLAAAGERHVRKAIPLRIGTLIEDRRPVDAGFYDRATLAAGDWFEGPAVVEAADTTVYVPAGFTVHVDSWGNLIGEPA